MDRIFGIYETTSDDFVLNLLGDTKLTFVGYNTGSFVFEGRTNIRVDVGDNYVTLRLVFAPSDLKCFKFNRAGFKLKDFLEGFSSVDEFGHWKEQGFGGASGLRYDYRSEEFSSVEIILTNNKTNEILMQIEFEV